MLVCCHWHNIWWCHLSSCIFGVYTHCQVLYRTVYILLYWFLCQWLMSAGGAQRQSTSCPVMPPQLTPLTPASTRKNRNKHSRPDEHGERPTPRNNQQRENWVRSPSPAVLIRSRERSQSPSTYGSPAARLRAPSPAIESVGQRSGVAGGDAVFSRRNRSLSRAHHQYVPQTWVPCFWFSFELLLSYPDKCLHGTAPSYLADKFLQSSDVEAWGRLRSASSSSLIVRRTWLSTVGDRAFPVAAARVWNITPRLHHPCEFSAVVWRHLFSRSFPDFL